MSPPSSILSPLSFRFVAKVYLVSLMYSVRRGDKILIPNLILDRICKIKIQAHYFKSVLQRSSQRRNSNLQGAPKVPKDKEDIKVWNQKGSLSKIWKMRHLKLNVVVVLSKKLVHRGVKYRTECVQKCDSHIYMCISAKRGS